MNPLFAKKLERMEKKQGRKEEKRGDPR